MFIKQMPLLQNSELCIYTIKNSIRGQTNRRSMRDLFAWFKISDDFFILHFNGLQLIVWP